MPNIFIVEDDDNIRELVRYALQSAGFSSSGFESSEAFWPAFESETPDLILLDIMLPKEDGLSILRRLKATKATASLPVIMLTAKNSELDRVRGLDLGADDYMTKPFSVLELVSRIKAVLRRSGQQADAAALLVFENVALHVDKHTVTVDGKHVALTFKEFELLHVLMANKGFVMTRDRLMTLVWGSAFQGETRTVDMHIKTLRQKLLTGGNIITTVRGVGYKVGE